MILIALSILPVVLVGLYVYNKDKQKESKKLLAKLFFSGFGSCILTLIISGILGSVVPLFGADESTLNMVQLAIYYFIYVALTEEFSKWIFVYKIAYNNEEFDELYDSIIYCVFVALGFACFENIFYVLNGGIETAIVRALTAVPGHACDGVFMGFYLGLSKQAELNGDMKAKKKNLILSLVAPMITHGVYDFLLSTNNGFFILLFFVLLICMYVYVIKKIKKVSSINRKMKYKNNFCPNCGAKVEGYFCPGCGTKNE